MLNVMRAFVLGTVCVVFLLVSLPFGYTQQADTPRGDANGIEALEERAAVRLKGRYDPEAVDAPISLKKAFEVYQVAVRGRDAHSERDLKLAIRYQKIVVRFHQWSGEVQPTYRAFDALIGMVAKPEGYGPQTAAKLAIRNADRAFEGKRFDEGLRIYRIVADAEWARGLEEQNYSRLRVGRCQSGKGMAGAAFETYKALVRDAPESDWAGDALLYAQEMYFSRRAYDEAIESYQRLLSANPRCKRRPYLMEQMAFNLIMKKEYEKAEQILKQVIKEYAGVGATAQRPEGQHVAYAKDYLQMIEDKRKAEQSDR
ncbi:MAG: hypothetical protein AMS16_03250 [Planctomycetes bacterium DG_58]|nr:MAG: hypothetical protein AMS16_03250 [Planctomycetes bacterium DG_58]